MLTTLASVARLADAGVAVDIVSAESIVLTRIAGAVINIDVAVQPSPSWLADTLVSEQLVHAFSPDAGVGITEVHLLLTSLASKASGTVAAEVVDQVSAVGAQKTGLLQTVVNIILAVSSLPSFCALTSVASLEQSDVSIQVT